MDAVEFSCPVDVALPPKFMGSNGFGGGGGGFRVPATTTNNEPASDGGCDRIRVPVNVNSSIERCSSSIKQKDVGSSSGASESSLWSKLLHSHDFLHERLTKLHIENSSEQRDSRCTNGLPLDTKPESADLQRKAGKVSRSSTGPSKRAKMAPLEDTVSSARDNEMKDVPEQGLFRSDKCQNVKQKNSVNGKRGDKRNSKASVRTMPNFSLASGENAFFGAYGLKPDINDFTKLVGDISLNELLEGTYQLSALGKGKGKKVENANDTFLNSLRKACSVLPTQKPGQSQNSADMDGYSSQNLLLDSPGTVSAETSGENSDKGDPDKADISSCDKDPSDKTEAPANLLNFPLRGAADVLERLALPPPKDLDSLLQDASKPSQLSRSISDLRSGKQVLRRASLPPFPWSHAFNGQRTNSEAAKLLTSRTLCQGRWGRIGDTMSTPASKTDFFTNLESLTFNQSLVPSGQKQIIRDEISQTVSGALSCCHCASSSVPTFDKAPIVSPDSGVRPKDQINVAMHCPRLLAAAETLCDIATQSQNHSLYGIVRWPKKLSQKAMKARKSKSVEKSEETHKRTSSSPRSSNQVGKDVTEQVKPSKRPKLYTVENKRTFSTAERRHSSASNIKESCMMPPPLRASEKVSSNQQKMRKLMATE